MMPISVRGLPLRTKVLLMMPGSALNREGIAVRSGHHCAQPILRRFGVESSVRPSFALYNTCADIDALQPIADEFKAVIVEDAAQAIGASWRGRKAGQANPTSGNLEIAG